jgi:ATP-dependent DNA helicase PIF1
MNLEKFKSSLSPNIKLNEEQWEFFETFFSGQNIFLTGSGGCGKSFCLNLLFSFLEKEGAFFAKTSTVGVSAVNINGSTLHSWLGCGLAQQSADMLANSIEKNKKLYWKIKKTKILFIDEISMCNVEFFDKIEEILRLIKQSMKPFGGIQILVSGDFLQLPSVYKTGKRKYLFESDSWDKAGFKNCLLKKLVRQDADPELGEVLNLIRKGKNFDESFFSECINAEPDDTHTRIFGINVEVDSYNKKKIDQIDSKLKSYMAYDNGPPKYKDFFDKNCLAPTLLEIKQGCRVMLLCNLDLEAGLCNGSVGTIVGFDFEDPIVLFDNDEKRVIQRHEWSVQEQCFENNKQTFKKVAWRTQYPLKLCWAITTHKSQSKTIERVYIDFDNFFEVGQAYVALSRCTSRKGMVLRNFSKDKIKVDKKCVEFYQDLNG